MMLRLVHMKLCLVLVFSAVKYQLVILHSGICCIQIFESWKVRRRRLTWNEYTFSLRSKALTVDDDLVCLKLLETLLWHFQYHGENFFLVVLQFRVVIYLGAGYWVRRVQF
jgi:hypothetical protein